MSYSSIKNGVKITPYIVELVADADEDIASLPTHYAPGSTCLVIGTSTTYMLNNQHEWVEVALGTGSGGGGGTIDASLATKEDIDTMFDRNSGETTIRLASTEDIDNLFK